MGSYLSINPAPAEPPKPLSPRKDPCRSPYRSSAVRIARNKRAKAVRLPRHGHSASSPSALVQHDKQRHEDNHADTETCNVWEYIDPEEDADTEIEVIGRQFHNFTYLPRELRDLVYAYVVADLPTRFWVKTGIPLSRYTLYPGTLSSICFVNKQLWQECTLAYLRRTRFLLEKDTQTTLREYLEQFPGSTGFEAVRMLSYESGMSEYGSKYGWHECPDTLISRLSGLRSLVLRLRAQSCVDAVWGNDARKMFVYALSEKTVRGTLVLDGLFRLRKLTHLGLICQEGNYYVTKEGIDGLGSVEEVFESLIHVIEKGFKERGGMIELRVTYQKR